MADNVKSGAVAHSDGVPRRDFLVLAGAAMGAVGAASFVWPVINSMNPSGDTLALASIEVDLTPIAPGQAVTFKWRGKPVFVRNRTPEEIEAARAVPLEELRDPQSDDARVTDADGKTHPEHLILVGTCTHLGCVPKGQKSTEPRGDFGGWLCPCHGSHYDTAGRIRKGPAPKNLAVPAYTYLSETLVRIG